MRGKALEGGSATFNFDRTCSIHTGHGELPPSSKNRRKDTAEFGVAIPMGEGARSCGIIDTDYDRSPRRGNIR